MYLADEKEDQILYIGKIHDKKWSSLKSIDREIVIINDESWLERVLKYSWNLIREFSISVEINELILEVSSKGNKEIDLLKSAKDICNNFRNELSIINLAKQKRGNYG